METSEFGHILWCDLEVVLLKIHSYSPWDTKMVSTCSAPDLSKPTVNVYICREEDDVFDSPQTYREKIMLRGAYRGHHVGQPARLKIIDDRNIAFFHPDPGMIIWSLVVKYVLTVCAIQADLLHIKGAAVAHEGRAYLLLGRGGSGKTEIARTLCGNGARLMANTHLLVDGGSVRGVTSNVRVREGGRDVYVPADDGHGLCGWLPIGAVFWVKYRTDGKAVIERMPPHVAKANMRYFAESISNWEIKEDIADHFHSDPLAFAEHVNRTDELLNKFCDGNDIYYANLDILSSEGLAGLMSVMKTGLHP